MMTPETKREVKRVKAILSHATSAKYQARDFGLGKDDPDVDWNAWNDAHLANLQSEAHDLMCDYNDARDAASAEANAEMDRQDNVYALNHCVCTNDFIS